MAHGEKVIVGWVEQVSDGRDVVAAVTVPELKPSIWSMRRQLWSRMCSAASNGSGTAAAAYRPSPTCSTPPTMTFSPSVNTNSQLVIQPYLPHKTDLPYQLRVRSHSTTLIDKTKFLNDNNFHASTNSAYYQLHTTDWTELNVLLYDKIYVLTGLQVCVVK